MIHRDDPAFTTSEIVQFNYGPALAKMGGLTKREYFAGLAMQGMMSMLPEKLLDCADQKYETVGIWIAANCVDMADALIAELNKETK